MMKTLFSFVLLLQIFLIISAFQAFTQAKKLTLVGEKTLLSFYKPFLTEIRLENNLRWSYSRSKYVKSGE
ncbi:MAG: hypothetical protein U9N11_01870 [Campylobacterota bacterium]|nr:hypothetical protein [Campylobacterota bacterium]